MVVRQRAGLGVAQSNERTHVPRCPARPNGATWTLLTATLPLSGEAIRVEANPALLQSRSRSGNSGRVPFKECVNECSEVGDNLNSEIVPPDMGARIEV